MRWMGRIFVLLAAVFAVAALAGALASPKACACSCGYANTPEEAVATADDHEAVFVATPTAERRVGGDIVYDVAVSAVYKGLVLPTDKIYTSASGTACGKVIALGKEDIFFGWIEPGDDVTRPEDALYQVSSCDPESRPDFDLVPALKQKYGEPIAP